MTARREHQARAACPGLFGSGLVVDGCGEPLGPGGAEVTGHLLDRAGFGAGDQVIDVGCGQGRGVGLMVCRGIAVIGIDADLDALRIARCRVPGAAFLCAPGHRLPFSDNFADGIVSECVLSVMPDKARALAEWHRVLCKGGRLAISDVYARRPGPDRQIPVGAGAMLCASRLCEIIAAAGFVVSFFEDRSDLLSSWAGRFIFQYGSLDALWGDAATAEAMRHVAPGYCMAIAVKPTHGDPRTQGRNGS